MSGQAKTGQLDPFRQRQVPDVGGRFLAERKRHERAADLMWTGVLVSQFTPFELQLLHDLGFLSRRDKDFVAAARAKQEVASGD